MLVGIGVRLSPHRVAAQHSPSHSDLTLLMKTGLTLLRKTVDFAAFSGQAVVVAQFRCERTYVGVCGRFREQTMTISITAVRSSM